MIQDQVRRVRSFVFLGVWAFVAEVFGLPDVSCAQPPSVSHLEQALRVPGAPIAGPNRAAARLPVPPNTAQAESLNLVREVYKADYDKAKSVADRQALAKKMLAKAAENKDDPAGQFVLLKLAKDIAAQSGDGQTALQAVDETAKTFQVDGLAMKGEILATLGNKARQPAEHKFVVEQSLILIDQSIGADRFELAETLGETALVSVRQAGATPLTKQLRTRMEKTKELAAEYEQVKAAAATLETKPTDPRANLIVGRYECLVKNDWDKGLPMSALGNDPTWKALATKELEGATTTEEKVKLGDGWWTLAESEEGAAQQRLQARAGYWYKQAMPSLTGLLKDKVEGRLNRSAAARVLDQPRRRAMGATELQITGSFVAPKPTDPKHPVPHPIAIDCDLSDKSFASPVIRLPDASEVRHWVYVHATGHAEIPLDRLYQEKKTPTKFTAVLYLDPRARTVGRSDGIVWTIEIGSRRSLKRAAITKQEQGINKVDIPIPPGATLIVIRSDPGRAGNGSWDQGFIVNPEVEYTE